MLHLPHRVVEAADGDDAHGDDAVRRRRHVLLGQELVVGPHQLAVEVAVPGLLQHEGDLREHHLCVDAVLVLLFEALLGRPGAGAGLEGGHLLGHVLLVDADAAGDADGVGLAVVHHHRIRAVGHLDPFGRALAHGRGHPVAPDVGVQVDMAVGRDDIVVTSHWQAPLNRMYGRRRGRILIPNLSKAPSSCQCAAPGPILLNGPWAVTIRAR